jgi:Secretion system C-terminal sorting domain
LPAGALALVKTTPHAGCATICQQGTPVVIDCYEVNTSGTADGGAWETDISLYPNPANDVVYYDHFEKGTIRIVDMQGKKVHEVVVNGKKGLGIAHLPDGVFAVVFENEKGLLVKKLVVKRY